MSLPIFTEAQVEFNQQRARAMMNEILLCVLLARPFYPGGTIPTLVNVKSYSDLHSMCDANTLGGWCDDEGFVQQQRDHVYPNIGDGAQGPQTSWMDGAFSTQEWVGHWIQRGAMRDDVVFLSMMLDADEIECLLDADRWIEAHGMVDDREARVGGKFTKDACRNLRTFLPALPQILKEFPRFADEPGLVGILRSIPPGWQDESWHNDAYPSFCLPFGPENEDAGYRLWLAEARVEDREIQGGSRFALTKGPYGDPANVVTLLETDDWATMLDAMSKLPGEEPKQIPPEDRPINPADVLREVLAIIKATEPVEHVGGLTVGDRKQASGADVVDMLCELEPRLHKALLVLKSR